MEFNIEVILIKIFQIIICSKSWKLLNFCYQFTPVSFIDLQYHGFIYSCNTFQKVNLLHFNYHIDITYDLRIFIRKSFDKNLNQSLSKDISHSFAHVYRHYLRTDLFKQLFIDFHCFIKLCLCNMALLFLLYCAIE